MLALGKLVILFVAVLAVHGRNLRLAPGAGVTDQSTFPHQVSIQLDGKHYCGGALISKKHVLTAAHCVRGFILDPTPSAYKGQRLVVEVGSSTIGGGTRHAIKRVSHHRSFSGDNPQSPTFMTNDIAVITLKTPVTESAKVKPIGLPAASSELPVGSSVTISGYGSSYVGGATSNILKTSPMRIVSQQECNDYYVRAFRKSILSSHICAKYTRGHGTCQGDSGGPLIQGNTIIGVVSGGNGVCGEGAPDVYTKVSHFLSYINYELNYDPKKPETAASPALAVNIDATAPSVQPPWVQQQPQQPQQPQQTYPTYPGVGNQIQFIDPLTGALLPPGSVVLVDPTTGVPINPVTQRFPQIPLYPLYPINSIYPMYQQQGLIQLQQPGSVQLQQPGFVQLQQPGLIQLQPTG